MDELTLYEAVFELDSDWCVEQIGFDHRKGEVSVHVTVDVFTDLKCPKCSRISPRYDKKPRRWRHLDTCQFITMIYADVPRINCREHGVLTLPVSWVETKSRFTKHFEARVIDWLLETSISAVGRQLSLSWNSIDGIMKRAVKRGMEKRKKMTVRSIGVDETSFRKGHDYVTVVTNQDGCVLAVEEDRTKESLGRFYNTLTKHQKENLESISMDMYIAYVHTTLEEIPNAETKIAFDKFHIATYLSKAVDTVRKMERREQTRDTLKKLKGTRFLWLKNSNNLNKDQIDLINEFSEIAKKTGRAWALKEYAMSLSGYTSRGWAEAAWTKWYNWAIRSRLQPMKTVAKMIKEHLWGIINAIVLNADNAMAESVNSKIKILKIKSRGYRNKERFRTAILFHYGGLDLHPH